MGGHGKHGLLRHGEGLQGYAALHIAKEAINATTYSVAIENNIKVQTVPSLRKRRVKLCANAVGYGLFILIALLLKYGSSPEIASWLLLHTQESTHALLFLDKTRQNWRQYSLKILTCVLDKLLMRSKQERHGKRL